MGVVYLGTKTVSLGNNCMEIPKIGRNFGWVYSVRVEKHLVLVLTGGGPGGVVVREVKLHLVGLCSYT